MPQTINNEDIWNKAKDTFVKKYNKQPEVDWEWAYVNKVYQTMGGTFGDMFIPIVKSLTEKCRLKEIVGLSDIKSFVRKFIDNPIKSAIVAYLIFKIFQSNKENFGEAIDFRDKNWRTYKHGMCHDVADDLQKKGYGKKYDLNNWLFSIGETALALRVSPRDHSITVSGDIIYDPVFDNEKFHTNKYKFNKNEYLKLLDKYLNR